MADRLHPLKVHPLKSSVDRSPRFAVEKRFAFGKNWSDFLDTVDESRIAASADSLRRLIGDDSLAGKSFLDIGSGSGLSSLAAHRGGARVVSFDYDEASVRCTEEIKQRFGGPEPLWEVRRGSILDVPFVSSLGLFDVVYSWGVLHHTGEMRRGIELASRCVAPGGLFAIAIYHDQGGASRRWAWIKRAYHGLPNRLRPIWVGLVATIYETKFALARMLSGRNPSPLADWRAKRADRGMSVWHDWVDWVGGWPFEVSSPDDIINPLADSGFHLVRLRTVGGGWGCNEYVFRKVDGMAEES
jgi:SAM-dependent methyltransferase